MSLDFTDRTTADADFQDGLTNLKQKINYKLQPEEDI